MGDRDFGCTLSDVGLHHWRSLPQFESCSCKYVSVQSACWLLLLQMWKAALQPQNQISWSANHPTVPSSFFLYSLEVFTPQVTFVECTILLQVLQLRNTQEAFLLNAVILILSNCCFTILQNELAIRKVYICGCANLNLQALQMSTLQHWQNFAAASLELWQRQPIIRRWMFLDAWCCSANILLQQSLAATVSVLHCLLWYHWLSKIRFGGAL